MDDCTSLECHIEIPTLNVGIISQVLLRVIIQVGRTLMNKIGAFKNP